MNVDSDNPNGDSSSRQEADVVSEALAELLATARSGYGVTARDDLCDFTLLSDAVAWARRQGLRFRLVDSGHLKRAQLEWLLEAGADFFTTDEFGRDLSELEGLLQALRRGKARMAFHAQDGIFQSNEEQESSLDLLGLGRSGAYIYITNRIQAPELDFLERLARECEAGGSHLVLYIHGGFSPQWLDLFQCRMWFHMDENSFVESEARAFFRDALRSSRVRSRFVLLTQGVSDALWLKESREAGVYLRFQKKQFDYRSPYKPLELASLRKRLPVTSYYLYPDILL